ncbi:MAG: cbb3-type cytochrome c oxidase subunit I, partial [Thermodesulfobacteriota bacterium]
FTHWIPAHAHLAVLGFVGMIGWGTCYFILPEMTGRPIHSKRLANLHYWLMFMGVASMMVVLTISGLIQGHAWYHGEGVYRVLPSTFLYNVTRVMAGAMIVVASWIGLYNLLRSIPISWPVQASAGEVTP